MSAQIILLEDDENLKRVLSRALSSRGFGVRASASPDTALNWLQSGQGELLLADVLLDGTNFLDRLGLVHRLRPELPVIVMSAQATASTAIDAEKGGVFEYLPKPFDLDDMLDTVEAALSDARSNPKRSSRAEPTGFIGRSAGIQASFKGIARAANSRAHVLVRGESGCGKRQAAEAVLRGRGISIEDAGILTASHPAEEIFRSTREFPHCLWLRLEEWDDTQLKAARNAMDAGSAPVIATVSTDQSDATDARLAARLSECVVQIPPLRDRREDIPALSASFLAGFARRDGQKVVELSKPALASLEAADWPGNVAELRSVLSRVALEARGRSAGKADIERAIETTPRPQRSTGGGEDPAGDLAAQALTQPNARQAAVDALDRALFQQALDRAGGNRSKAAGMLGLNRNTLARRLGELGMED